MTTVHTQCETNQGSFRSNSTCSQRQSLLFFRYLYFHGSRGQSASNRRLHGKGLPDPSPMAQWLEVERRHICICVCCGCCCCYDCCCCTPAAPVVIGFVVVVVVVAI